MQAGAYELINCMPARLAANKPAPARPTSNHPAQISRHVQPNRRTNPMNAETRELNSGTPAQATASKPTSTRPTHNPPAQLMQRNQPKQSPKPQFSHNKPFTPHRRSPHNRQTQSPVPHPHARTPPRRSQKANRPRASKCPRAAAGAHLCISSEIASSILS